jgi:predicted nicotinamide N-methyase
VRQASAVQFASWLALEPVPFVPELVLHQADDMHALWEEVTALTGQESPPYWAFPWLGGQAVARYLLDNPAVVAGRRVLDLATGSGLVALAARRAGAAHVLANDIDPIAGEVVLANAAANDLDVTWWCADLLDAPVPDVDVLFAGDILYDRDLAPRVMRWLQAFEGPVYVGDPGRDYLPRQGLVEVASYEIPTTRELEGVTLKRTRVFTLSAVDTAQVLSGPYRRVAAPE